MKNKKSVMMVSAFLILIFHLRVFIVQGSTIELFIRSMGFVGVDMFFFLSAYSLAKKEIIDYGSFLWSRCKKVYLKFVFFAIVACIYGKWSINRLLMVITGYELFQRGGGAFLWFLPAIMIFYIIFPLVQKMDRKYPVWTMVGVLSIWFIGGFFLYRPILIFWNRIPILLLGSWMGKDDRWKKYYEQIWVRVFAGVLLTVIGSFLAYNFAFQHRLQVPFADAFYVVVLVLACGLIFLADLIPECAVVRWIGSSTLEIYGIQMIFGYKWMNKIITLVDNKWLVNLFTLALVIVISIVLHYGFELAGDKKQVEK